MRMVLALEVKLRTSAIVPFSAIDGGESISLARMSPCDIGSCKKESGVLECVAKALHPCNAHPK